MLCLLLVCSYILLSRCLLSFKRVRLQHRVEHQHVRVEQDPDDAAHGCVGELVPLASCTVRVALSLLAFVTEFGTLAEVLLELAHAIEADAREGEARRGWLRCSLRDAGLRGCGLRGCGLRGCGLRGCGLQGCGHLHLPLHESHEFRWACPVHFLVKDLIKHAFAHEV